MSEVYRILCTQTKCHFRNSIFCTLCLRSASIIGVIDSNLKHPTTESGHQSDIILQSIQEYIINIIIIVPS
jgi:hypothetical protein